MNITLKQLTLTNFKGIRNLTINFKKETNISGSNGVGKSTIYDAFCYLLFDKNSADEKDFNIKNTVDTSLNKFDHIITAVIEVDGIDVEFKKIYREKWVTKRGNENKEFTGHETELFYQGVPMSAKDYRAKIDAIISEQLFKLITNPNYFNSLKWQDRRDLLGKLAGDVSNEMLLTSIAKPGNDKEISELRRRLEQKIKLNEFKDEIRAKKKTIRQTLDVIPVQIREVQQGLPPVEDWEMLTVCIETKQADITNIDLQIEDNSKAHNELHRANIAKSNEKFALEQKIDTLKSEGESRKRNAIFTIDGQINSTKIDIQQKNSLIAANIHLLNTNRNKITELTATNDKLRAEATALNDSIAPKIDESTLVCPTCSEPFKADKKHTIIETAAAKFNTDKANKVANISKQGKLNKAEIERLNEVNTDLTAKNAILQAEIDGLQTKLLELKDEKVKIELRPVELSPEIETIQKEIAAIVIPEITPVDNTELKAKKAALQTELDGYKQRLNAKDQIERGNKRIAELEQQERAQAQEIASLEKQEFVLEAFEKAYTDEVESRVNGKFKIARFKMFNRLINGGIEPTCDTLKDGVPYSDLNTGGKIQVGLDIINTLSQHYNVYAPVFCDNRESVIDIPEMQCQLINLRCVEQKEGERKLIIN